MLDSAKGSQECIRCRQTKPLPEFRWDRGRKNYRHVCLVCCRAKSLARYHRTKGERGSKLWRPNEDELAIIREHYPLGGSSACMALIPGKSRAQIQQVARHRGIKYGGPHVAGSKPNNEAEWAVPAHDYCEADIALRNMPALSDWRHAGALCPSVGLVLGEAA